MIISTSPEGTVEFLVYSKHGNSAVIANNLAYFMKQGRIFTLETKISVEVYK